MATHAYLASRRGGVFNGRPAMAFSASPTDPATTEQIDAGTDRWVVVTDATKTVTITNGSDEDEYLAVASYPLVVQARAGDVLSFA